jgi:membrane-associated phospholipid phosphatase
MPKFCKQAASALMVMVLAASAHSSPSDSPRQELVLSWADAGWAAGGLLASAGGLWRYYDMPAADSADLRRSDLLPFDRWAAGSYSTGASLASDAIVVSLCALPAALSGLEAWQGKTPWNTFTTDVVILGEAYTLSSALDIFVRSLRVHPRPFVYGTEAPLADRGAGEASGSFYSGHASAAFLAATYLSCTYPLRHPEFKGGAWLWAGSLGAAATVASLRVAAGKHFPSDVVVGAAAGAFFGWAFPKLHLRTREGSLSLGLQPRVDAVGPLASWRFR